jgi:hypothetical protein
MISRLWTRYSDASTISFSGTTVFMLGVPESTTELSPDYGLRAHAQLAAKLACRAIGLALRE